MQIRPVAYLDCPACVGEHLFVMIEPPWDEHMSRCIDCGYCYGYMPQQIVIAGERGQVRRETKPVPVLDAQVLRDGMRKHQLRVAAELKRRHGGPEGFRAEVELRRGIAEQDPVRRLRRLNSTSPRLIKAAEQGLAPQKR